MKAVLPLLLLPWIYNEDFREDGLSLNDSNLEVTIPVNYLMQAFECSSLPSGRVHPAKTGVIPVPR